MSWSPLLGTRPTDTSCLLNRKAVGTHSGALSCYHSQGFVSLVQSSLKRIHWTWQLCSEFAYEWFDSSMPFEQGLVEVRKLHSGLLEFLC